MGRPKKIFANNREKVAILAMELGLINSWAEVYAIASNNPYEEMRQKINLPALANNWKSNARIQNTIEEVRGFVYGRDKQKENALKERILTEREGEGEKEKEGRGFEHPRKPQIDYSNPENQKQKLNELINTATDSGEVLDALKVIIQGQKADKEGAKEGKQVRAYLPLMCSECPLLEEKRKKGL